MNITSVVGGQWGDEGKGKIVDVLSEHAKIVARYQGGANAGHTVYIDKEKIVLHQIPSGILRPDCICILGNGMVVDPDGLKEEIECIESHEIKVADRLILAHNAHLVSPVHKAIDRHREGNLKNPIGTTCKGIGPAYVDKYNRVGLRGHDLQDIKRFEEKLISRLNSAVEHRELPESCKNEIMDEIKAYLEIAEIISKYVGDAYSVINDWMDRDGEMLVEGAQGTLLDVDHGTYPYVTSSNPSTAGISQGLGLPLQKINRHIGIFKSYCTRVGEGPFPSEQNNIEGERLREIGGEFGATTGRPRRCGWFDIPAAKFSAQVNGLTEIALTKLDILDSFPQIPVCIAYKINGELVYEFSAVLHRLDEVEPVFTQIDGWQSPTSICSDIDDLPENARKYIAFLSRETGVDISMVSTGPTRDQTLFGPFSQSISNVYQ